MQREDLQRVKAFTGGDGKRSRIMIPCAPQVSSRHGCIYVCVRGKCAKSQSYPADLPERPRRALWDALCGCRERENRS